MAAPTRPALLGGFGRSKKEITAMLKTIASIALALASLVLGETIQIGQLLVTRSSLFGFEVIGPRVCVLDLDDAAAVLARAAELAATPAPEPATEAPKDLLEAPRETWPGSGILCEVWKKGWKATSREASLRRALMTVQRESGQRTVRASSELGADRERLATVTLTYSVPKGARVPALT